MVSERKLSGAVGGRSARACDNCVKRRAQFYCAADDAFLCRPCDSSVHSANPLARRHERVRLRIITSSVSSSDDDEFRIPRPTWQQGFTRKTRTPRRKKKNNGKFLNISNGRIGKNDNNRAHAVPEIGNDEVRWPEENEDQLQQLLYRVPIMDPELRSSNGVVGGVEENAKATSSDPQMDIEGFVANVESLMGKGKQEEDDDLFGIGELGFLNSDEDKVKIESSDQNLDSTNSRIPCTEEESDEDNKVNNQKPFSTCKDLSRKITLRLDHESVLAGWDAHKSPWMTGERPRLNSGDCWPDIMGTRGGAMQVRGRAVDGGREARVWRYKEKRQRRLFAKRIRYEVRKRNAEKRPRVKGRFVKRPATRL